MIAMSSSTVSSTLIIASALFESLSVYRNILLSRAGLLSMLQRFSAPWRH